MLQLWVKNKAENVFQHTARTIGLASGRASSRWLGYEDSLVAMVLGMAAYLPFNQLMAQLVSQAKLVLGQPFPPSLDDAQLNRVELWPTLRDLQDKEITIGKPGKGSELDGLWQFGSVLLIVEAKKPNEAFYQEQIVKYCKLINGYAAENSIGEPLIWSLLIGNGVKARLSLEQFTHPKLPSILYLEWQAIPAVIDSILNQSTTTTPPYTVRALNDIKASLELLALRSFSGLHWPPPQLTKRIVGKSNDLDATRRRWFMPKSHPAIPKTLMAASPTIPFAWLREEENLNGN